MPSNNLLWMERYCAGVREKPGWDSISAILAATRRLVSGGDPRMVMEQLVFRIAAAR